MYAFELVGEDDGFAAYEAASVAKGINVIAPGIAVASELSPYADQLGWTRTILDVQCQTKATVDAMSEALRTTDLDRSGAVAVRARAVRGASIDTQAVERELGGVLVDSGFAIHLDDPDHVLRVLVSADTAVVGWVTIQPGDDVGSRRPTDRPFFQPGSMSPRLARGLVNIGGVRSGVRMVDPMCGTGGIVIEAALVGGDVLGLDVQERMVRGTRRNVRDANLSDRVHVVRADAARLPIGSGRIDTVVFDAPYGRQSKIAGSGLLEAALADAHRVADTAVVVADRRFEEAAEAAGWHIRRTFARPVHRSLTRYIAHLERR